MRALGIQPLSRFNVDDVDPHDIYSVLEAEQIVKMELI